MKILVVEDNYEKIHKVHKIVNEHPGTIVETVMSVDEALHAMRSHSYEILVVDIQIPNVRGGDVNPEGGIELMAQIELDDLINLPLYILGVTGGDDGCREDFQNFGWKLFNSKDSDLWLEELERRCSWLSKNLNHLNIDVAILTALEKTELEAVLNYEADWRRIDVKGFSYWLGVITLENGPEVRVIAASSERMGVSSASELASRVAFQFSPKIMIMTGICAGIRGKVQLGDIVVADFSWDWSSGKVGQDDSGNLIFSPDPHQIPLNVKLKNRLKSFVGSTDVLDNLYMAWNRRRGDSPPGFSVSPMACGPQVLANSKKVDEIIEHNRKVMAIDMESYGFMNACNSLGIVSMVVKGVCDFADREKNDGAQEYAAYVSAEFAFEFLSTSMIGISKEL